MFLKRFPRVTIINNYPALSLMLFFGENFTDNNEHVSTDKGTAISEEKFSCAESRANEGNLDS